jgi:hypothetical protein
MNALDQYTRRVIIAASIAALYVIAWWLSDVFILVFGSLILATALRAGATRIARIAPMAEQGALAVVVVVGLVALLAALFWLVGGWISFATTGKGPAPAVTSSKKPPFSAPACTTSSGIVLRSGYVSATFSIATLSNRTRHGCAPGGWFSSCDCPELLRTHEPLPVQRAVIRDTCAQLALG